MVAAASSRILIGDDMIKEPELMLTLKNFSGQVGNAMVLFGLLPARIVAHLTKNVENSHNVIASFVEPEVKRRRQQQQGKTGQNHQYHDMIGYLMDMKELDGENLTDERVIAALSPP